MHIGTTVTLIYEAYFIVDASPSTQIQIHHLI